ncbi:MAG: FAD-binding protein [Gammaproteobacteria bacterium]|nr:FAD-binding protein [Gammaproteobacteria bacterium]
MPAARFSNCEVDLLVVGAGAAGWRPRLRGRIEGLEVLVCEKTDQVGGTTATAAGTLWIPGNTQGRRAGFDDTQEDAERYLDGLLGHERGRDLRSAFLAAGPRVIDYFEARSELRFTSAGQHPDYRELPGAGVSGRALSCVPFDGRLLGEDFVRVRPPIPDFLVLGGMMVGKSDIATLTGAFRSLPNFLGSASLVARHAADRVRYPRGTRLVMGNALVARLLFSLRKYDVPIMFASPLLELLRESDRVAGAVVAQGAGQIRIHARRGVVLATGGLGRNADLRGRFMHAPFSRHSLSSPGNSGDGIATGLRMGAAMSSGHRTGAFWAPASMTGRHDEDTLFPHLILDRAKPGLIAVNSAGHRFVNEACSYHDFVEAMFESDARVPSIPAYLICDAAFVARYGLGIIHPGTRRLRKYRDRGYVTCANTLDDLAGMLSIDRDGLRASVTRNNEFALSGVDEDFGKGTLVLNRFNGDASRSSPCLGPIDKPPFCALKVWPADLGTSNGLVTSSDAQVLGEHGGAIPGLYACGNDMASVFHGTYPGPGITLGPALVSVTSRRCTRRAIAARVGRPHGNDERKNRSN